MSHECGKQNDSVRLKATIVKEPQARSRAPSCLVVNKNKMIVVTPGGSQVLSRMWLKAFRVTNSFHEQTKVRKMLIP